MLIKNIEVVDQFKEFKYAVYRFTRQVNGSFDYSNFTLLHLFLMQILIILPFSSVLFKRTDYFPHPISQIFRTFLISSLPNTFHFNILIFYAAGIALHLLMLGIVAAHFVFGSVFSIFTKFLCVSLKLLAYLIVPFVDLAFNGYQNMLDPNATIGVNIFAGIFFFTSIISIIVSFLAVKFDLRMMRKKNVFWNLDNDVHFYGVLYLVFKTMIITLTDVSVSLCLLSLGVWFYHRRFNAGCVGKQQRIIQYNYFNCVAAADVSVLVCFFFGDSRWAFGLWVVLVTCSLVHCVLTLYRQRIDKLHLPDCDHGPEQFYHFYYCYKQSFKGEEGHLNASTKQQYQKIYYLHKVACKSKSCYLSAFVQSSSHTEMEQLISRVIQSKKNDSMNNRVVYQLWNLELGRKCTVDALVDKRINIKQEFMVYSIQKLTKDSQVTIKNSQSNKSIISKVFYDLIYEISSLYSQFYQELARTHPKIDLIVDHGTMIRSKIEKLKSAYSDLLKSKLINFKMIELYMEFLTNFVGQNALDKDDIERLMKAQQNIYFEDISQNYLPTVSLYLETGSIENANSQAQKLLHSTRFELKYKNIADVTYPALSIDKLKQVAGKEIVDAKDDPIYSFFRQSDKQYGFTSIVFQQRVLRQKKLMVMQMDRLKFSDQKNYFLVTADFELKLMMRKVVKVKNGGFRTHPLLLNWQDLYNKYIVTNQQKIVNSKMVKIPTVLKQCIIVVKRLRCLIEDYLILQAQVFVTSELIRKNRSSIITFRKSLELKKSNFQFQFQVGRNDQNQKLTFYGLKGSITGQFSLDRRCNLAPEYKQLQNELVSSIIQQNDREYDKDIKTYRLFQGQLYNVDLQDRQAYNNLFQEHISQSKRIQVPDNSSLQCYIFVAVVVLGIALMALSVLLILKYQSSSDSISTQYSQFINIESLIIDFKRILCILRDYASGFILQFPDFSLKNEVGISYGRIQNLKNQMMFTNDEYTIQFQSLAMTGTIIELIDVILAHVTQVLSNGDLSVIEDIHSTCVEQLNDLIKLSQANIYGQVVSQINSVSFISNIVLYSSLGIVAILYFLMVFYCFQSNTQLKKSLSSLLYISDNEAHMHQENAEKMKYAVEMIRKNFEIDSQNLLISETDFKRRKNPKQAIQSKEIVYSIAVMATLGLAIHLSCLFIFQTQFTTQLNNFQTMKDQTISTTTIYHTSAQLSNYIDHMGIVDSGMLNIIRGNLTYLEYNLNNFLFTPELNAFISLLYFANSCSVLTTTYNLSASQCSNTTPGFTVVNPFQIGLGIYINRQNYYFFNNLTQDFAHTGVYSGPFVSVLTNLTQSYKAQSLDMIRQIAGLVNLFNGCIIAIDLGYIFAFIFIYYYFRNQCKKIRQILLFFDEKFKSQRTVPEEKQEIQIRNQEQSEESSQEEKSLLEVEPQQNKKNSHLSVSTSQKKRSSIQAKKPFNFQPQEE